MLTAKLVIKRLLDYLPFLCFLHEVSCNSWFSMVGQLKYYGNGTTICLVPGMFNASVTYRFPPALRSYLWCAVLKGLAVNLLKEITKIFYRNKMSKMSFLHLIIRKSDAEILEAVPKAKMPWLVSGNLSLASSTGQGISPFNAWTAGRDLSFLELSEGAALTLILWIHQGKLKRIYEESC